MTPTAFEPNFHVAVHTGGEGTIVSVAGELDSGTCDQLLQTFRAALADLSQPTITLDLRDLSFIDSAGTRTVILIEREAQAQGASLEVVAPRDEVTELLQTAGVIERFQLKPNAAGPTIDTSALIERVELELPREPQAPARARAEVREALVGGHQAQVSDAVLLASEVVTNAVIHPGDAVDPIVGLRIFRYPEGLRIEVDDGGSGFDPSAPGQPRPDRGRGLFLVDRLASRWGTEHLAAEPGRRFMVWFELDWRHGGRVEVPDS